MTPPSETWCEDAVVSGRVQHFVDDVLLGVRRNGELRDEALDSLARDLAGIGEAFPEIVEKLEKHPSQDVRRVVHRASELRPDLLELRRQSEESEQARKNAAHKSLVLGDWRRQRIERNVAIATVAVGCSWMFVRGTPAMAAYVVGAVLLAARANHEIRDYNVKHSEWQPWVLEHLDNKLLHVFLVLSAAWCAYRALEIVFGDLAALV